MTNSNSVKTNLVYIYYSTSYFYTIIILLNKFDYFKSLFQNFGNKKVQIKIIN